MAMAPFVIIHHKKLEESCVFWNPPGPFLLAPRSASVCLTVSDAWMHADDSMIDRSRLHPLDDAAVCAALL